MSISNKLIYNNRLKAANEQTSLSKLKINLDILKYYFILLFICSKPRTFSKFDSKKWLVNIMDPERRVVFLNLDTLTIPASRPAVYRHSESEASIEELITEPVDLNIEENSNSNGWFNQLMDMNSGRKNTQTFSARSTLTRQQSKSTGGYEKPDYKLVVYLVRTILSLGVKADEVAVITPFNTERNYFASKLEVRRNFILLKLID